MINMLVMEIPEQSRDSPRSVFIFWLVYIWSDTVSLQNRGPAAQRPQMYESRCVLYPMWLSSQSVANV